MQTKKVALLKKMQIEKSVYDGFQKNEKSTGIGSRDNQSAIHTWRCNIKFLF